MASVVRCEAEGATEESVMELLQQHFSELSSAADLLFELRAKDFGTFDYTAVVNGLCGRLGKWENSEHAVAVVWVAAAFLMVQKLLQTGNTLDADLSISSPNKIDYAMFYKYCAVGKSSPTRATSPLTINDVQLVYLEGMRLLVKHKVYKAYTRVICTLAREILATSSASVAVHGVIGVASVACSSFAKVGEAMSEVPLPPGCMGGDTTFPKEDVFDDLVQTMTGPLYGFQANLSTNAAICGNEYAETGEVDWPGTMAKWEQNLIWLKDWDVNVDGLGTDTLSATAAMVCEQAVSVSVGATQTPSCTYACGEKLKLEHSSARALIAEDKQAVKDKVRICSAVIGWDGDTEKALTSGRARKLGRHTGWVCGLPDMVREIALASVSYYAYSVYPSGNWVDVESLWSEFVGYIGCMIRGYLVDHDTEADIGESNVYNWLCRTCANASTKLQITRATAKNGPIRTQPGQQMAWTGMPYFYYGRRHSGLARRVYSKKFRSLPNVEWGVTQCSEFLEPIATPEGPFRSLGAIIQHILWLTGITVDDTSLSRMCATMPEPVDPVKAGMCVNCRVDGIGLEMMMYGNGIMIMAAMLPESARRKFVWELDSYGNRALPILYSRIISGCRCSGFWFEDVLMMGYGWSWSACGADSCDDNSIVVEPISKESGCEWLRTQRVKENLKNLMVACKVEFESMPTIRDQLQSGHLDASWCYLSCANKVKAIIASRT